MIALEQRPITLVTTSKVEQYFSLLYGVHMASFPKKRTFQPSKNRYDQERSWVFLGVKKHMKSVATQATLYAVLADPSVDTTYYTPNGYYRRDQRLTDTLRWLNAFVLDFDHAGYSVLDILERIEDAGLPDPTAIVKTPGGGYHITFAFTHPVRATNKAIRLYTAIMEHMAKDIDSDLAAVGANRIFRTPTENNLVYFEPKNMYDFDLFKAWRDINHPFEGNKQYISIKKNNVMNHPAIQYLFNHPCPIGKRDQTAFTLALAMKASNISVAHAEQLLLSWYERVEQSPGDRFTERDALYKVRYVYRKDNLHAPSAEVVRELTGMNFTYYEAAKPRSERQRVHVSEWKEDILALLHQDGDLYGTQQEMATKLNCPLASFKKSIKQLEQENKIIIETQRGQGGFTIIRLPEPPPEPIKQNNVVPFPNRTKELKTHPRKAVVLPFRRMNRENRIYQEKFIEIEPHPKPPD